MPHIRTLRLNRGLTLTELALQVDIPTRTLAEIEYGYRPLAPASRGRLAQFYKLQPHLLEVGYPKQTHDPRLRLAQILGSMLSAGFWVMLNLALSRMPAAESPSIAPLFPNAPVPIETARLSSARLPERARLPTTARNQPREATYQAWQPDESAITSARPPAQQSTAQAWQADEPAITSTRQSAPQSTAEERQLSDAVQAPTETLVATPVAPIAAPTEIIVPTAEVAPAAAEALAPTVEATPAATEVPAPTTGVAPTPSLADAPELSAPNAYGSDIAAYAVQFVGAPYAWGGADPAGFDCSGLTQYVYRQFGVELPRIAVDQYSEQYGTIVGDPNALQPGDLVFFANTYEPGITHVGIYIANGNIVQAMSPGVGVAIGSLQEDYWAQHYYGALRPLH